MPAVATGQACAIPSCGVKLLAIHPHQPSIPAGVAEESQDSGQVRWCDALCH